MELKKLIRKRIEENVPDYDIVKVERYEYLFEMIATEFASEQVKLLRQPDVIKSVCENCNQPVNTTTEYRCDNCHKSVISEQTVL